MILDDYIEKLKFSNKKIIDPKDSRIYKSFLEIRSVDLPTYLIYAAIHNDSAKNNIQYVKCDGVPINGVPYHPDKNYYCISCYEYLKLGKIPISYELRMKNSSWAIPTPIPDGLIKKHLTTLQKNDIKKFRNSYNKETFSFKFLQMVS